MTVTSPTPPRLRHPEKARKADSVIPRKPKWIRTKKIESAAYYETRRLMRDAALTTVCEEAACPNIGECWSKRHATMMIMGEISTRGCSFCNVTTCKPGVLDLFEPARVAKAVKQLGLRHVVITSVDRDDLEDGGADHIARTIRAVRHHNSATSIEVLTPDFLGKGTAGQVVFDAAPDVFNHNLETVPRLYAKVRPGARYYTSLRLLDDAKRANPGLFTKSGLMVGLGETMDEVRQVMDDLRAANVDFLTVGQYSREQACFPPGSLGVDKYWEPVNRVDNAYGDRNLICTCPPMSDYDTDES